MIQDIFHITRKNREAVANLCNTLSLEKLNAIPTGFNNNILWNVGHMVAIQQLIVYGLSQTPFRTDQWIIDTFKNKTKPERIYEQSDLEKVLNALLETVTTMEADFNQNAFGVQTPFISKSLNTSFDTMEAVISFNMFHEGLHTGVIQKYIQLLK